MQLTEHRYEQQFFLRHADAQSVTVIDRTLRRSIVVSATRIVEDFPAQRPDQLDDAAVDSILALQPEVVLLGTGARAVFPPQAILAQFLKRGIGLETMDSAAAARTFNVLAGEGRNVVAVFLLPD
ncbi:MAG TPA: MTH938/NDUFAF3 family protein [Rudaea sp.]|nr:MTH938/NDUFAF3 family protein [Rudaea sp.]